MKKVVYEKPEFEFNDLFLFDGVADTCWGYKETSFTVYIYRDKKHDLVYNAGDEVLRTETIEISAGGDKKNGCDSVYRQLMEILPQYGNVSAVPNSPNAHNMGGDGNIYIPIS